MKPVFILLLQLSVFFSLAQNNNSFLWRIEHDTYSRPSYLFGTIHIAQKKFMVLGDSVYTALMQTRSFYGELDYFNITRDMASSTDFLMQKLAYLDSVKTTPGWKRFIGNVNKTYHTNIDPEDLAEFTKVSGKITGDIMKPEAGASALDIELASMAKQAGKKTGGLETLQKQIGMLYDVIDARLRDSSFLFTDEVTLAESLKRLYIDKKFDSLGYVISSLHPAYTRLIFTDRNYSMADSMEKKMENGPVFFAVGAGHLVGKEGIVPVLREKGYRVNPVFSKNSIPLSLIKAFVKQLNKEESNFGEKDTEVMPEEKIEEVKVEEIFEDVAVPATEASKKTKRSKRKKNN